MAALTGATFSAGMRLKSTRPRTISLLSVLLVILTMFLPPPPLSLKPRSEPSAGSAYADGDAAAASADGLADGVSAAVCVPAKSAAHAPAVASDTTSAMARRILIDVRDSAPANRSRMTHLRYGHPAGAVSGDAAGLAAASTLGQGVVVTAPGLLAALGELPGAVVVPGAVVAPGAVDAAGAPPVPGCAPAPSPPDDGCVAGPGLASEPCATVMSASVSCSFGWMGTNGAVAAYSGPGGPPGNGSCGAQRAAMPATIA